MNSVHFEFGNEILTFTTSNCWDFKSIIATKNQNSSLGLKKSELTFESSDGATKLTFIPDDTALVLNDTRDGFTFRQYFVNFGLIKFNDISNPHKLYFSSFSKVTVHLYTF